MKKKKSSTNFWIWFIVLFALWQLFKFGVLRDGFKKETQPNSTLNNLPKIDKEILDKITEDIKKNNISKEINIFILPDTFIASLGFNYYKTLVEHIELFFEKSEKRNKSTNYKDYLEKIIEKKEMISS